MKIKVRTTGDFMLIDVGNGQEIDAHTDTTVEKTPFIDTQLTLGQLEEVPAREQMAPAPPENPTPVPVREPTPPPASSPPKKRGK